MKTITDKPPVIEGPRSVGWGAAREDWIRLHKLGLTEDLLPVVSNLKAKISPHSVLKGLGKTPSEYNRNGQVRGFADWTSHHSTLDEVKRWASEPDYGICIQTRHVRALDVDVEDPELAARVVQMITGMVGPLPLRYRAYSSKCLLAFRMEGHFPKRKMVVGKRPDGSKEIIEFLGDGQQFVAYGTHPSGARYEWRWNDFDDIPLVKSVGLFGGY